MQYISGFGNHYDWIKIPTKLIPAIRADDLSFRSQTPCIHSFWSFPPRHENCALVSVLGQCLASIGYILQRKAERVKHRLDKEGFHSFLWFKKYKIYINYRFNCIWLWSWILGGVFYCSVFTKFKEFKEVATFTCTRWFRFQCPNHE